MNWKKYLSIYLGILLFLFVLGGIRQSDQFVMPWFLGSLWFLGFPMYLTVKKIRDYFKLKNLQK